MVRVVLHVLQMLVAIVLVGAQESSSDLRRIIGDDFASGKVCAHTKLLGCLEVGLSFGA